MLTVVWQSITRLYWPTEETARVKAAIAEAGERIPISHVSMEYCQDALATGANLVLDGNRMERPERRRGPAHLGQVADHGIPVTLRVTEPC